MRKYGWLLVLLLFGMLVSGGCGVQQDAESAESTEAARETADAEESIESGDGLETTEGTEAETEMKIKISVNGQMFTASPEKNEAADAFLEMMEEAPVTIEMSDYAGFEKVGSLGESLPADNRQMTTTAGDIVLYQGNQIVIFYGSNSWSYTKLGRVDDLDGWEDALGSGDVKVTFSLDE